jgi:hypothetical protein
MATVSEVIDQILRRLDELSTTAPVHWTRAQVLVYVNDALNELNLIALEFQGSASLSINSTDNVYDVPDEIVAIAAVHVDREYLMRSTVDDLDKEIPWEKSDQVRIKVQHWAPLGLNKILIARRPHVEKTATLEGVLQHTAVTDSSESLPCRDEYVPIIEDFSVERATFREGGYELNHASGLYTNFIAVSQDLSGRNVASSFPRYVWGGGEPESLRERSDSGG